MARLKEILAPCGLSLIVAWIVIGAADVRGRGDDWRIFWTAGHTVGSMLLVTTSHFAYTPGAAWILWPFARLSMSTGYFLYVSLMVILTGAAAVIASRIYRLPFTVTAFMALAWAPFTIAICLGQNSPVALLFVTLTIFAIVRENEILAGASVGLLLYKPTDAVALIFLLSILRQWRALLVVLVFSVAWYLVSVGATKNWLWPIPYVEMLSTLYSRDVVMNADFAISVPTFLARLGVPTVIGWWVGAIILLGSAPPLLRASRLEAASLAPLIGVAASPHAWGYEAILALPAFWLAAARPSSLKLALLVVAYITAPLYLFVRVIHFNVLALPVLGGVALWVWREISTKGVGEGECPSTNSLLD